MTEQDKMWNTQEVKHQDLKSLAWYLAPFMGPLLTSVAIKKIPSWKTLVPPIRSWSYLSLHSSRDHLTCYLSSPIPFSIMEVLTVVTQYSNDQKAVAAGTCYFLRSSVSIQIAAPPPPWSTRTSSPFGWFVSNNMGHSAISVVSNNCLVLYVYLVLILLYIS